MMRRFSVALAAASALALTAGPAGTQPAAIGSVNEVRADAFGTPPGLERRALAAKAGVFASERIDTGKEAWAQLRFVDSTDFRVGSGSTVVLDRFVFDPDKKAGELTINATQGVFRFVTGTMKSESYRIRTPSALIGVRGTDFVLAVAANGAMRVAVNSGAVEIIPLIGNRAFIVAAGNQGTADPGGGNVEIQPIPDSAKGSTKTFIGWFDPDGALGPFAFDSAGKDAVNDALTNQTLRTGPVPNIVRPPGGGAPPSMPRGGTFKPGG
ncbi:MAG: FecR family protein [Alphaproteobacteria bacterium]